MKIQIRNSIFETNSSSMHSIAIVKPDNIKDGADDRYGWQLVSEWLKPGKDVEVNHPIAIDDESIDFGRWPFRILSTMYEKAQYAIASYGDKEHFQAISDICRKYTGHGLVTPTKYDDVYFYKTGLTQDENGYWDISDDHIVHPYDDNTEYDQEKHEFYRIDKESGAKIYDIGCYTDKVPYYGCIDHQSMGTLQTFLERHALSLEDFLRDPKYVVIIDGDEYCAWQKMFDAGLCQKENFIETGLHNHEE